MKDTLEIHWDGWPKLGTYYCKYLCIRCIIFLDFLAQKLDMHIIHESEVLTFFLPCVLQFWDGMPENKLFLWSKLSIVEQTFLFYVPTEK